jgi:hypothetical protein
MRRIKLGVLLAAALFVVGALSATGASAALPEMKNSAGKVPTGVKFTSADTNPELKTPGVGITIKCKEESGSGKITGAKTVGEVHVTYSGCEAGSCGTAQSGTTAGVIETNTLSGTLGYVNESNKTKVGEKLKPASGTEFVKVKFQFESFSCPGTAVSGAVIGEALPLNSLNTSGELNFTETGGKQTIQRLEGETSNQHLTAFGFESTLVSTETITFTEAVKIEA